MTWATELATEALQAFGTVVRASIEYAFGTEASDLRRRTPSRHATDCYLRIRNSNPDWEVEVRFDADRIEVRPPDPRPWLERVFDPQQFPRISRPSFGESRMARSLDENDMRLSPLILHREMEIALYEAWPTRAVHLPAGRTGIMHSYHVLASNVVRQSAAAGIRPIEIEPLPGTSADFISLAISPERGLFRRKPYSAIASIVKDIERDLGATIELDRSAGLRMIVAVTPEGSFPLFRTSSMISELAPLVLALKYSVSRGDHLTIDEPLKGGTAQRSAIQQLQAGLSLLHKYLRSDTQNTSPQAYLATRNLGPRLMRIVQGSGPRLLLGSVPVRLTILNCGANIEV